MGQSESTGAGKKTKKEGKKWKRAKMPRIEIPPLSTPGMGAMQPTSASNAMLEIPSTSEQPPLGTMLNQVAQTVIERPESPPSEIIVEQITTEIPPPSIPTETAQLPGPSPIPIGEGQGRAAATQSVSNLTLILVRQSINSLFRFNLTKLSTLSWSPGAELDENLPLKGKWETIALKLGITLRDTLAKWERDERLQPRMPEIVAEAMNEFIDFLRLRPSPPGYMRLFLPQLSYLTRRYGSRFLGTLKYDDLLRWFEKSVTRTTIHSPGLLSAARDIDAFRVFMWNMLVHNRFDFLLGGAERIATGYRDAVLVLYSLWNEELLFQEILSPHPSQTNSIYPYMKMKRLQDRMDNSVKHLLQLSFVHSFLVGIQNDKIQNENMELVRLLINYAQNFEEHGAKTERGRAELGLILARYEDLATALYDFSQELQEHPAGVKQQKSYSRNSFFWPASYVDYLRLPPDFSNMSEAERLGTIEKLKELRKRLQLRAPHSADVSQRIDAV